MESENQKSTETKKIGVQAKDNSKVKIKNIIIKKDEPQTLWDLEPEELEDELARCFYKRSKLNKRYALPLLLVLLSVGALFIGLNFKNVLGTDFIFIIVVFGIGFPMLWFAHIEKEIKPSLAFYRERINTIKLVLIDKS